jgi:hypothetical protein
MLLCCSAIVALKLCLLVKPLLSNGCYKIAYFGVVAFERAYMLQYYIQADKHFSLDEIWLSLPFLTQEPVYKVYYTC